MSSPAPPPIVNTVNPLPDALLYVYNICKNVYAILSIGGTSYNVPLTVTVTSQTFSDGVVKHSISAKGEINIDVGGQLTSVEIGFKNDAGAVCIKQVYSVNHTIDNYTYLGINYTVSFVGTTI